LGRWVRRRRGQGDERLGDSPNAFSRTASCELRHEGSGALRALSVDIRSYALVSPFESNQAGATAKGVPKTVSVLYLTIYIVNRGLRRRSRLWSRRSLLRDGHQWQWVPRLRTLPASRCASQHACAGDRYSL